MYKHAFFYNWTLTKSWIRGEFRSGSGVHKFYNKPDVACLLEVETDHGTKQFRISVPVSVLEDDRAYLSHMGKMAAQKAIRWRKYV